MAIGAVLHQIWCRVIRGEENKSNDDGYECVEKINGREDDMNFLMHENDCSDNSIMGRGFWIDNMEH